MDIWLTTHPPLLVHVVFECPLMPNSVGKSFLLSMVHNFDDFLGNEDLKKAYIDLMGDDGLENGFESLKHSTELYSLPGDYR